MQDKTLSIGKASDSDVTSESAPDGGPIGAELDATTVTKRWCAHCAKNRRAARQRFVPGVSAFSQRQFRCEETSDQRASP